jgi:hypothetical protein
VNANIYIDNCRQFIRFKYFKYIYFKRFKFKEKMRTFKLHAIILILMNIKLSLLMSMDNEIEGLFDK